MFICAAVTAEMPVKTPAAPIPYDWSGLYLGANFGGAFSSGTANVAGTAWDPGATEFIGGFQPATIGSSATFWLASRATSMGRPLVARTFRSPRHWVRSTLPPIKTGSVLSQRVLDSPTTSGSSLTFPNATSWSGSSTVSGWMAGGGIEYAFKPNWTVKLEYDFLGLGNWTASTVPTVSWNRDVQMIKMGVNYKFDGGTPAASSEPATKEKPETDEDRENLAKSAQNPIADMISVPFQNNANFNVGPFNRTQDVLNIQPVIPLHLNEDWIVISRTIAPLTSQPDPVFNSSTYGIGDTSQSLLLSPERSGIKDFSWALGPIATVPTASDVILGTGKVLLGPEVVIIYTPGHWVMGAVASNSWSVAGDPLRNSVNLFNTSPLSTTTYRTDTGGTWSVHRSSPPTGTRHRAGNGPFLWVAVLGACLKSKVRLSMRK
jgi:opacity protein-like surface antigen